MLIVDTGPLLATADRADKDHAACRELLEGDEGPLVTTAMVIAEAAYLIDRQLGAKAEVARDLSYRLYTICERRKWAQEAMAYNTLVLSWSDVHRLAGEIREATPQQGELI